MSVILHPTEVTTIRNVQDRLSNILASSAGVWNLELKFFRSNPASFQNSPAQLIYTVTSNQDPGIVNLFTNGEALVCDEELLPMVTSKLKSLWVARQTFRIEGEAYKTGDVEIRVGNAFLSGNFKGLVIQISVDSQDINYIQEKVATVISQLDINASADEFATTKTDLARQYYKLNK